MQDILNGLDLHSLSKYLIITNADGTPMTVFNGMMTVSQLIGIAIALIVLVVIIATLKEVIRIVLSIITVLVAALYLGVTSPAQLQDTISTTIEQAQENVQKANEIIDQTKDIADQNKDILNSVKDLTGN